MHTYLAIDIFLTLFYAFGYRRHLKGEKVKLYTGAEIKRRVKSKFIIHILMFV